MTCPPLPMAGVYAIQNMENGRVYVGASVDVDRRIRVHHAQMRRGQCSNPGVQLDLVNFGVEVFRIVVLERLPSATLLAEREQAWAEHFFAFQHGYNRRRIARPDSIAAEAES